MTTKETFLSLAIGASSHETAEMVDFDALDQFVSMFIGGYTNRRGAEIIREELAADALSETTTFLTRMVEVGTVQFLSENSLLYGNEEETNDLASVVAHGINISMASELQRKGLDPHGANIFFGIEALYGLIGRVIVHINDSRNQEGYIFSLVSLNLVNFVNGTRVE
jgi:hypothetical protein